MALEKLAQYEILDRLGAGGMGEVYRARDTKLGREVALKLLPDEVSRDPERVARFRREAKLLASLNHPNIAALHDLEESDGRVFLVMELVEGQDLGERLKSGPLPLDRALDVAQQITEGLEEAHTKGIVHRDLKPANVMVGESGRIKLLDFGLARAYHGDEAEGDPAKSPTITAAMTQQGVILGTAAYMSPEQARGKTVDRQSDVWAFGALLFEMLTGRRVFEGETISDSIGAILHKEPEWELLPPKTPPQVQQLLRRCLERDRELRLRDIGDARVALAEARRDPTGSTLGIHPPTAAVSKSAGSRSALLAVVAVLGLALGAFAGARLLSSPTPLPHRMFDLGVELVSSPDQTYGAQVVISRDARAVAFVHDGRIWSQDLDALEAVEYEGSAGASAPFWSPDGGELGWIRDGKLWKVPARGGRPVAICEIHDRIAGGAGADWGEDGRILFAPGSAGIYSVSAQGGTPQLLIPTADDEGDLHEPFALSGDRGILYVAHPKEHSPNRLALWRNGTETVLYDAAGASARVYSPVYDGHGYILFRIARGESTEGLWAVAFDASAGELRGEPFLVEPDASAGSVSRDGTLVFVSNPQSVREREIVRVGSDGRVIETLVSGRAGELDFALSPDGNRICFNTEGRDGGEQEIWVKDLRRGTEMRLFSSSEACFVPLWSPDGKQVYFGRAETSARSITTWRVPADGSREAERVANGLTAACAPDGTSLFVIRTTGEETMTFDRDEFNDVWLVPVEDPGAGTVLSAGQSGQFVAGLSPDGRYLLYASNVSGQWTLYLTRYPEMSGRWQVSPDGVAGRPSFTADGSAIVYEHEGVVYSVDYAGGGEPELGKPRKLLELPMESQGNVFAHPDGESFVAVSAVSEKQDEEDRPNRHGIKIVQNWRAGIR